jgi:hypothetical protein
VNQDFVILSRANNASPDRTAESHNRSERVQTIERSLAVCAARDDTFAALKAARKSTMF